MSLQVLAVCPCCISLLHIHALCFSGIVVEVTVEDMFAKVSGSLAECWQKLAEVLAKVSRRACNNERISDERTGKSNKLAD
jgi:hypothetical protein